MTTIVKTVITTIDVMFLLFSLWVNRENEERKIDLVAITWVASNIVAIWI